MGDGTRREADAQGTTVLEHVAESLSDPHGIAIGPDGSLYIANTTDERIRRVAPNGTASNVAGTGVFGLSGDGGPGDAPRASPRRRTLRVASDGSLLIADSKNNRIRRVAPGGTISTLAGGGSPADGIGDDGPATSARLADPTGVAAAADGTVYIADRAHHRVRMVTPDGAITTVAGGPEQGSSGDGGPAAAARLNAPRDLAVAPDGSIYIADTGNDRVREVATDGRISTVAGGGPPAPDLGDGGLATNATLSGPSSIVVSSDGTIHVADRGNDRVRSFEPLGLISTSIGGGEFFSGEGGPAADAVLGAPMGVAEAPDGTLYVAERDSDWVEAARSTLDGFGSGDMLIPSEDGTEVYRFNRFGRHLSTLDSLTGAPRWSFGYDTQGRLLSATDVDGRALTVERNGSGVADRARRGRRPAHGAHAGCERLPRLAHQRR